MLDDLDFGTQGFDPIEFGFVDIPADVGGKVVMAGDAVVVDDDDLHEEFGGGAREDGLDGDGDPVVGFVLGGHDDGDGGEEGVVEAVVAAHGVEEVFDSFALVGGAVGAEVAEVVVGGGVAGEVGAFEGVVGVGYEVPGGGGGRASVEWFITINAFVVYIV